MTKKLIILGVVLLGLGILGMSRWRSVSPTQPDSSKVRVAASFYPYSFLAEQVGGDLVQVTTVTPAGVEPHDFEPSSSAVLNILKSDLLLANGILEPWFSQVQTQAQQQGQPTVLAIGSANMNLEHTQDHETEAENQNEAVAADSAFDPHIWLSPVEMKKMAAEVAAALSEADPESSDHYTQNLRVLEGTLTDLDKKFQQGLATCEQRTIITNHEAFGYLAREYNFSQKGITGLSPEAEPSLQDLAVLAQFAQQEKIKYIFFEEQASPELAQTLAEEVGAQVLVLNPLESLTPDQLELGEDYFSVMEDNLANLRLALSCR